MSLFRALLLTPLALASPLLSQVITIEWETPPFVDPQEERIEISSDSEGYFLSKDGTSVFYGKRTAFQEENDIFTGPEDSGPAFLLNVDEPDGEENDLPNLVFNGTDTVGYINGAEKVYAANINTGEKTFQGADAIEVFGITDDGRVLYTARHEDGFDRVMLGDTEIYVVDEEFEGRTMEDRIDDNNIVVTPTGTVIMILEGRNAENQRIDLIFKNDTIVQTGGFSQIWPYGNDGYLLQISNDLWINGTELVHDGIIHSNILATEEGDLYFHGEFGIHHYDVDAEGEKTSLILERSDVDLIYDYAQGLTSRGELVVFEFTEGVVLIDLENKEAKPLLKKGDQIDGEELTLLSARLGNSIIVGDKFANDQLLVFGKRGTNNHSALYRIDIYGTAAPVYTASENCPPEEAGDASNQSLPEETYLAHDPYLATDPIQLNEGPCGGNWHTRIWENAETDEELDFVPGTEEPFEDSVFIDNLDLIIEDSYIELNSLQLTGSLTVDNALKLKADSQVEGMVINRTLETFGTLTLSGDSRWQAGDVTGVGSIVIKDGLENNLNLTSQELRLDTTVNNGGEIVHMVDELFLLTEHARLTSSGFYTVEKGTIRDTYEQGELDFGTSFTNRGTLFKTTPALAVIDATFSNQPDAIIEVKEGELWFEKNSDFSGSLETHPNSQTIFNLATFSFSLLDDFSLSGNGEVLFQDSTIDISGGGDTYFEVGEKTWSGELDSFFNEQGGGVFLQAEAKFTQGGGTLFNSGMLYMLDGSIEVDINNIGWISFSDAENLDPEDFNLPLNQAAGGISVDGGSITGDIDNAGIFDFGGDELKSTIDNIGAFYIFNGLIESQIENKNSLFIAEAEGGTPLSFFNTSVVNQGTLTIAKASSEAPLDIADLSVTNQGKLVKTNAGSAIIGSLINEDTVQIKEGELTVEKLVELKPGIIEVGPLSKLTLAPLEENPIKVQQFITLKGEGEVFIRGASKENAELNGTDVTSSSLTTTGVLTIDNIHVKNLGLGGNKNGFLTLKNTNLSSAGLSMGGESSAYLEGLVQVDEESRFSIGTKATFVQSIGSSVLDLLSLGVSGSVEVKDEGNLSIRKSSGAGALPYTSIPQSNSNPEHLKLTSGNWVIEKGGNLELKDVENLFDLNEIGLSAELTLRAGQGSEMPILNGNDYLGTTNTDSASERSPFSLKGKLTIDGIELTVVGSELIESIFVQGIATAIDAREGGIIELKNDAHLNLKDIPTNPVSQQGIWGATILGRGFINGRLVNEDYVKPGSSPGIITVNGDYFQTPTGILEIEIFGSDPGTQYDQLVVTGAAALAGTLHIVPTIDISEVPSLQPILADTVTGSFDRIIVETSSGRNNYIATPIETGIQISPTTIEPTTFTEFQDALFSEADTADEDIGLTTSDPDGDEFSNLLEYAMDLNPWVINENPMIVEFEPDEVSGFAAVQATFPWAKGMTDVDYVIQVSFDMAVWTNLPSTVQDSIDQGTHNLLTIEAAIDPPAEKRLFVRVMVVEVP